MIAATHPSRLSTVIPSKAHHTLCEFYLTAGEKSKDRLLELWQWKSVIFCTWARLCSCLTRLPFVNEWRMFRTSAIHSFWHKWPCLSFLLSNLHTANLMLCGLPRQEFIRLSKITFCVASFKPAKGKSECDLAPFYERFDPQPQYRMQQNMCNDMSLSFSCQVTGLKSFHYICR